MVLAIAVVVVIVVAGTAVVLYQNDSLIHCLNCTVSRRETRAHKKEIFFNTVQVHVLECFEQMKWLQQH